MIPKLIHQILVKGTERPPITVEWATAIKNMHPDYVYKLHEVAPVEGLQPFEVSNIQRLKILYEQGGVYLDWDMRPVFGLGAIQMVSNGITCDTLHGKPHHAFIAAPIKDEGILDILQGFLTMGGTDYWGKWREFSGILVPRDISAGFCHYYLTKGRPQ